MVPARDGAGAITSPTASSTPSSAPRWQAPLLIAGAALLFAVTGLCVKLASDRYSVGELVFYRAFVGLVMMAVLLHRRGIALRTPVPAMHVWRNVSGVASLCLWFFAVGGLPLATAMTLNYTSSVWMALFLIGGASLFGNGRIDGRLFAAVLTGFVGVALILRPTIEQHQLWHGLGGLASGLLAAMAYLQISALGRAGEPETRTVFYFSLAGVLAGMTLTFASGGPHAHTAGGLALLLVIGTAAGAAQLMMTRAYSIGQTMSNAALQYLGIVFSFIFGVWLFDDPVTAGAVAGMLLIVGAGAGATATLLGRRAHVPAATTPTET